ncbi:MAG TPA: hypothetical protein VK066_28230 [Chloroflexota bacterium]|nr:hypothetical protein [Chloroflexota bacterium]
MSRQPDLPEDLRKQIEDALARGHVDRLPAEPAPRRLPPPRPAGLHLPDWRPHSPSELLLAGALIALVGWMFRFPYSSQVFLAGLVCIALAVLTLLLGPRGRSQHYWRGRPVELPPETWADRLYRLLYRG